MMRILIAVLPLAACAAPSARPASSGAVTLPYTSAGLERVIGANAAGLTGLFGAPQADVREGTARRLQFGGPICVLDTYLYPRGGGEAKVTYLDARQPDGSAIDRASCVAALVRKSGGK